MTTNLEKILKNLENSGKTVELTKATFSQTTQIKTKNDFSSMFKRDLINEY